MKNVVFDLNGTIIFDGKYHEIAWKDYIARHLNRELTRDEFQNYILGRTNRGILEHFWGKGTLSDERILELTEEKEAMYRDMYKADTENFCLVKGCEALFDFLKENGANINIATGSNITNLKFYFEEFDLGRWFDMEKIAFDDGTLRGKPAPDMYLRATKNMGADPKGTIVFEDGPSGVNSAYAAGIGTIVGIYGDSSKELLFGTGKCKKLIHDYEDLEGLKSLL